MGGDDSDSDTHREDEKRNKRKVRFHGRVQFKTIRHVKDFSADEIRAGWYRKRDFARMSEEVSEVAERISDGQTHDGDEELCTRGLEHLIDDEIAEYRAEKMIQSVDAVLDEQDEQRFENIFDQDAIAQVYGEIAAPLLKEAYLVALRDALDASCAAEEIESEAQAAASASQLSIASLEQDEGTPAADATAPPVQPASIAAKEKPPPPPAESPPAGMPSKRGVRTSDKSPENGESTASTSSEVGSHALHDDDKYNTPTATKKKLMSPASKKYTMSPGTKSGTLDLASPAPVKKKVAAQAKASPTRRKRTHGFKGTELAPLVRRMDGTFTFRNRDLELEKAEMSEKRKAKVKNSLFRLIDAPEEDGGSIRDSMKKFIDECNIANKDKDKK